MKERGTNRMRVIDLLVDGVYGKKLPKKIEVNSTVFVLDEGIREYKREDGESEEFYTDYMFCGFVELTDKVKIIEENNKIKKLPANPNCIYATDGEMTLVVHKINEIIDKLNSMEK